MCNSTIDLFQSQYKTQGRAKPRRRKGANPREKGQTPHNKNTSDKEGPDPEKEGPTREKEGTTPQTILNVRKIDQFCMI